MFLFHRKPSWRELKCFLCAQTVQSDFTSEPPEWAKMAEQQGGHIILAKPQIGVQWKEIETESQNLLAVKWKSYAGESFVLVSVYIAPQHCQFMKKTNLEKFNHCVPIGKCKIKKCCFVEILTLDLEITISLMKVNTFLCKT